jgi:hypothetical protein
MRGKARLRKGRRSGKPSKLKVGLARLKTRVREKGYKPYGGDAGLLSAKMVAYSNYRREHRIGKTKGK